MRKKKIIFLRSVVPFTTAYYYFKAMQSMDVVVVDVPFNPKESQETTVLPEGDLLLLVDCGLPVDIPNMKGIKYPKAYISIDSCHKLEIHKKYCHDYRFDFIWVAQKHVVRELGPNASWLPLAADEEDHAYRREFESGGRVWGKIFRRNYYDIGMCAAPYEHRKNFEKIFKKNGLSTNFHFRKKFGKDATRETAYCTVGFNLGAGFTGERGMDVNMRVFETMANGQAMLLTNWYDGLGFEELFDENKHYVAFKTMDEAVEKAKYFAKKTLEAARIARKGQEHILQNHTYFHRCQKIVEAIR